MEIKWVKDSVVEKIASGRGRKANGPSLVLASLVKELEKNPNKWAEFPMKLASASSTREWKKKYKNLEVRTTGGNALGKDAPGKKNWTVYVRVTKAVTTKRAYNKTGKYSKAAK